MARFLFDTNHLTHYEHRQSRVRARCQAYSPGEIALSIVTVEELIRGRLAPVARRSAAGGPRLVAAYGFLKDACDLIRDFPIMGFDAPAEAAFRGLKSSSPQSGTNDLRIAATALANNLIVATSNTSHFAWIPGLTIEDWTV